jgi:hypothetical protein
MIKYVVTRPLAYYKKDSSWHTHLSNSTRYYRWNIMADSILFLQLEPSLKLFVSCEC